MVVTSLAEVVSGLGWRQFHVAETEKYAHVTYFFNGGVEAALARRGAHGSCPAPRSPPTTCSRDMSAAGVTDELVGGHRIATPTTSSWPTSPTRTWSATRVSGTPRCEACTFLDGCLGRVADAVLASTPSPRPPEGPGALLAITADHGNADVMRDAAGDAGDEALAQPGAVPPGWVGRATVAGSRTASSPTSRRRSWPWSACRRPPGMTGRSLLDPGGADG